MPLDGRALSRMLFDSLALSAWKQAGEARWALRVNPSSGNLHPTEATLLVPALDGLLEHPAVCHYAPREHGLERRASIPVELWADLTTGLGPGCFFVGLTSIHWREAWKYGERAFRYCQHDAGHAVGALSIAAAGLGWRVELVDDLATAEVAELVGVFGESGPEAERADVLLLVRPGDAPAGGFRVGPGIGARFRALDWRGEANELSDEQLIWEAIERAAAASLKPRTAAGDPTGDPEAERPEAVARAAPGDAPTRGLSLRRLVRQRRSCLALDGRTGMSAADFYQVLRATRPGRRPFDAFPWTPRTHLALFVHRVDGLPAGLYWLQRDPRRRDAVRAACRPEFLWERPDGCPDELELSLLFPSDLRRVAAQVSCHQEIAADGAFSLGMIVELERAIDQRGAWFYPRLFWETGALGQALYLEAEALGLRSTGIGCFFDDAVHGILGVRDRRLQSLYHFTVGSPVDDPRLTTLPAYPAPS